MRPSLFKSTNQHLKPESQTDVKIIEFKAKNVEEINDSKVKNLG